jgi:hypothetical protein
LLEAIAAEGWVFSRWEGDLTGISNSTTDYKTVKYGDVTAIFVEEIYTITAVAVGPGTINGVTSLIVEVEHGGASPTFVFAPDNETLHHISSIKIDNNYTGYATEYTFPDPITSDHDIVVTFNDIGTATVPADINAQIFVDPIASLLFNNTDGGILFGIALTFPEGTSIALYDITTNATDADGLVIITIQLNGSMPVSVYRADTADALYSDVTSDGVINGHDVSTVANAIKSLTPHGLYDVEYDIDRNGILDENDVQTVNENKGATLTELNWWVEGDTLFIETEHWTTFRCR